MWAYFRPWRRKIGIVTLVVACVFAAGWVRSQNTVDGVGIRLYGEMHDLCSAAGGVYWIYGAGIDDGQVRIYSHDIKLDPESVLCHLSSRWITTKELCGFVVFFEYWEERDELTAIKVPYWSIVIPLALLSAYLLLSKPEISKPKPTLEA